MNKLKEPIKFSIVKARILVMIGPLISILSMSFGVYFLGFMLNFWNELFGLLLLSGMVLLVVFHSYLIVTYNIRLNRNIKELREAYPVLEQDWYDFNYADYLDKDLQLLVYGDYLICYRTFDIIYLPQCLKLRAFMRTGTASRRQDTVCFQAIYNDGNRSELRTYLLRGFWGVNQMAHKEFLFTYIENNYDYIELQTIS